MRRPGPLLVLSLALSAAAAGSCGKPERAMRIAIHSAPQSFDPHLQNEVLTSSVLANIFDSLTEFDDESHVQPALALDWRNPDDRTWVFRLRPGIRFHDGRPLEAEDVVFSLQRARSLPGTGLSSYLVEVDGVRALDRSTVEIRTRRPLSALAAKLTPIAIVPRDVPDRITRPVGTGTYRLSRASTDRLELEPSGDVWRGRRHLPPLTFVLETEAARRLGLLLAGDVDVATDLREESVRVLRDAACCREIVLPGSTVEYLRLSPIVPAFRDLRVRQAVDLAIDRAAYVATAHDGIGQPAGQLVMPGVFGFAPDVKATQRDVPRARQLLAEAGYPSGLDVVLEYRPGRRGDLLAAQLAEAGIRVTPRESAWTELHPRIRRAEVGFYFGGVVAQTAEASDVLDGFVHTRDEASGYGATNHSRYSNPKADALIEAAAGALDLVRRRGFLQEAMRVVMKDDWILPIDGLYEVYGVRKNVRFSPRLDRKLLGREISRD